jgi:protein TonB
MKRKNEKIPEFDEIIFENRNKTYGAYNLRKQYKSVTSLSVFGGIAISAILVFALSFTTVKTTATTGPKIVSIVMVDPLIPKVTPPPVIKPPESITKNIANLKPVVTDDTSQITSFIPTTESLLGMVQNGIPNDTNFTQDFTLPEIPVEMTPHVIVEEMPEYPGGKTALLKFVGDNLNYPEEAQKNNIEGKVFLKFVVNVNGLVDRVEIIKGVDPLLDSEAVRVVKILPRFTPGKQGGVPVPVWYVLPINFKIQNN